MLYLQNATSGLAAGVTYGLVALALVIVFRATGVVNFAAGEMATFTTFIAWELVAQADIPFFEAMAIVAVIAAGLGLLVYLLVIHPARGRPEFVTVMITFGLYELFNGLSNSVWNPSPRSFPSPVTGPPLHLGAVIVTRQNLGNAAVAVVAMLLLAGLFRFTRVGLGPARDGRQRRRGPGSSDHPGPDVRARLGDGLGGRGDRRNAVRERAAAQPVDDGQRLGVQPGVGHRRRAREPDRRDRRRADHRGVGRRAGRRARGSAPTWPRR